MNLRPAGLLNLIGLYTDSRVVAKLLLSNDALKTIKLSTIAYELGFSDVSTFSKSFQRETGMLPGQWREQQKEK